MRAVVFEEVGRPEIEEIPRPEPDSGEVLIRVKRVQLSQTECRMSRGEKISYYEEINSRIRNGDGRVFGHEFCGVVQEVGEDVTEFSPGDRVYAPGKIACGECPYCTAGYTHLCGNKELIGYHRPGALAEYTTLPAGTLCQVSDGISDAEAAAMQPLASALLSVYETDVEAGNVVAVIGAGVMGYNIGQIARSLGSTRVYTIDLVPEKLDYAESRGLIPIDGKEEDPTERIRSDTDGIGADIVFEAVGGEQGHVPDGEGTLADGYRMLRRGGKLVQIGNIPGDVQVRSADLRKKNIDWIHASMGVKPTSPNANTGEIAEQLVANGEVSISEYVTHELEGLESVEEAIDITLDPDTGLGPAQLIVR